MEQQVKDLVLLQLCHSFDPCPGYFHMPQAQPKKKKKRGVPIVAQWLTNPTRNHEVAGSIPGLAQWVKNPVLP